jgi:hypothetical protein
MNGRVLKEKAPDEQSLSYFFGGSAIQKLYSFASAVMGG